MTTAKKRTRWCGCIDRVSKLLKAHGQELNLAFTLETRKRGAAVIEARATVDTQRIVGTRGKMKRLVATHCPFCGAKYPEPKP